MIAPSSSPIRVFVIQGYPILLLGLERLFDGHNPEIQLVGNATDAAQALELLGAVAPDLILLDIDDENQSAVEAIPKLIEKSHAKILVLTGITDEAVHDMAIISGASGILQKKVPPPTILLAIEKVHENQLWLNKAATRRIFLELSRMSAAKTRDPDQEKIATLTDREREIVGVVASKPGASAKVVAQALHISEHTLRNHLTSVYSKLEVSNRVELYAYALRTGLSKGQV